MNLEVVIGLEIHVQLKTKSKMFCPCANVDISATPNTAICPICMGHPGTLPVVNKKAVEYGVLAALALNMDVSGFSKFDRKSYFYPDLPKGYQISQYDQPLAHGGYVEFFDQGKAQRVGCERLHLEEDTAKNIHRKGAVLIDFNRAGMPLMEIVTLPEIKSPRQARLFLQELRLIMRYIGVSDADMEKGQLRCDANISLRPAGDPQYHPKTEIKNLNSFKSVEKALAWEIERQSKLWETGKQPEKQSTRGWDEARLATVEQRFKETASDYRYFPEPDIPPLMLDDAFVNTFREQLPELPQAKRVRFADQYGFKLADIDIIVQDKALSGYVEKVVSELMAWLKSSNGVEGTEEEIWEQNKSTLCRLVSGWLLSKLFKLVNEKGMRFADQPIAAEDFAGFLTMIFERRVNSTAAQTILYEMFQTGKNPRVILEEKDLGQAGGEDISAWVDEVIAENPDQVAQYKAGKEPILKFLIGMVMKKSKGKADPEEISRIVSRKLKD